MATRDLAPGITTGHASVELAGQWRRLTRLATAVAIVTSPVPFVWLQRHNGWSWYWALAATVGIVIGFRGLIDLGFRRLIPWPSLFGTDDVRLHEEDVVARRRTWFWRRIVWLAFLISLPISIVFVIHLVAHGDISWIGAAGSVGHWVHRQAANPQTQQLLFSLPVFFLINFLIFMGPLLMMGVSQIRGFEPGDANWGVKLDDVRGQVEAKEEVRRIVSLWQSGEAFEKAGGKRERGLLFFGAPGTGKTMLAKAIATGFNSPFVTIPGSGFAQTFIGIDAVIVRFLARKAKKLARKWGGQCIVFIDEIDAVGMRRQALGGARSMTPSSIPSFHDHCFYGPFGALNPSGDLILESRAWRERLFELREPPRASAGWLARVSGIVNQGGFPGMFGGGGGGLALNQLLITMDGVDSPPFWRRFWTNRINQWLDASYIVPRRVGKVRLRMPPPKPLNAQIYFIGATNVPLENLDPALRRPGRMGRHVWFRTPTKDDRKDIFDLYLAKVQHEDDLDGDRKRDELARITNGYAQPLDARLLTPTGWTTMGDVAAGDLLLGADGEPTPVIAVHPRGEMEVFRIRFNDGTSADCTADHLWTVESADPRMVPGTLTLAEIRQRGLRWSPAGSEFYLPRLAPVQFASEVELPIEPYLLGALLGDGGFMSETPDFCTADKEMFEAVGELVPAGVELKQHGPMNWWLSGGSRRGVPRSQPNPLTGALRDLGLWKLDSRTTFVPKQYLWASIETRLALLQGLMDTDATCDYRRGTGPTFYSHSRQLANHVAFLARSLGGTARVRSKREGFRVALDLPDGLVPFRLERKASTYRSSRRPFRKRILAVEPIGTKPAQCVTVAASDGLYVTDGFAVTHNSPAMIEQVCSMALTYAHHDARQRFGWNDLIEAMTTVESGTAIGVEYVPEETRAVAIHEAGHAVASHVYVPGSESTRLSIRMRSGSLGHHMALEKEERFSSWNDEEMGKLVWTLGSMAAEHVFFGQNATGVGGDIESATARAAYMVGASGMGPERLDLGGKFDDETGEETRQRIAKRFERIGLQIMNRTGGGGPFDHNPIGSVLSDPSKRAFAAQILGQAYVKAYHLIEENKDAVEKIADALIQRKELYGDELIALLNDSKLHKPEIDVTEEAAWPKTM
jgi:ATP-dependent Zn protease